MRLSRWSTDSRRKRASGEASRPRFGGSRAVLAAREAASGLGSGREEPSQPHQIVRRAGEGHDPVDARRAAMLQLPQPGDDLQPAEDFLNLLARPLTDRVALVPRGAPVDGAALGLLRHMRREARRPRALHEVARIVALVGADGRARRDPRDPLQQTERILHFGAATRAADHGVHHEAMAIVDERARLIREHRRRVARLARHARVWVRHRAMRRVAPLLAVKAHAVIAGIDRPIRVVVLGPLSPNTQMRPRGNTSKPATS